MGGRSDLPSFYEEEEGFVVSATIDKYIYLNLYEKSAHHFWLQYKEEEVCQRVEEIQHPIIREAFLQFPHIYQSKGVRLQVESDIPSGTGLGSSSSFTVGLLNALQAQNKESWSKERLAEEASDLEIKKLKSFIGKQDQYCAAYGGFLAMKFTQNGKVETQQIKLEKSKIQNLEDHLCVFFSGIQRDGAKILESERKSLNRDLIRSMRDLAHDFHKELIGSADCKILGEILANGWEIKQRVNQKVSTSAIQEIYEQALKAGIYGGKLLGAGGGGYLMFLCPPERQEKLQNALPGLQRLPVHFSHNGSEIIQNNMEEESQ